MAQQWLLKRGLAPADCLRMPTFFAMLVASVAGWLVESPVRAIAGPASSMAASLLVGAVAYFLAKKFASDLRGGS